MLEPSYLYPESPNLEEFVPGVYVISQILRLQPIKETKPIEFQQIKKYNTKKLQEINAT